MIRQRAVCLCFALVFAGSVIAQEPIIEVSVAPEEVAVGEPLQLRISIYVPTWFAKAPQFPSFEISNAVTRLPPDSSRSTSRRVGQASWAGVTRRYQIYPLMGANFRIDSQDIVVVQANPGGDPIRREVPTGDITFRAIVPAGAEGLDPYVAGTSLRITQSIEGDTSAVSVGDAVVVTYVAELEGLSSMFLPEMLAESDIEGVSIYPEQPTVEDDNGIGRRIEKVTYIFNAGGEFSLPAVSIDWWNRDANRVETASVPPLVLTVEGPPLDVQSTEKTVPEVNWRPIAVALLILIFIWPRVKKLIVADRAQREEKKRAWLASEEYAWRSTRKAFGRNDAHQAHDAMVHWLARLEPGLDSRTFARRYGSDKLIEELESLNHGLYANANESANLGRIERGLSAARRQYLAESEDLDDVVLPPLNP